MTLTHLSAYSGDLGLVHARLGYDICERATSQVLHHDKQLLTYQKTVAETINTAKTFMASLAVSIKSYKLNLCKIIIITTGKPSWHH